MNLPSFHYCIGLCKWNDYNYRFSIYVSAWINYETLIHVHVKDLCPPFTISMLFQITILIFIQYLYNFNIHIYSCTFVEEFIAERLKKTADFLLS